MPEPPQKPTTRSNTISALVFLSILALLVTLPWLGRDRGVRAVPYSELVTLIESGKVDKVTVGRTELVGELRGDAKDKQRVRAERLPGLDATKLVELLQQKGVPYAGSMDEPGWWSTFFTWVLPLGLLALWFWSARRGVAGGGGALRFGRSSAKVYDKRGGERVTFADVAGVDEAVGELTRGRRVPQAARSLPRHRRARAARRACSSARPARGKTLLARAVAGEADVPFFSITGSRVRRDVRRRRRGARARSVRAGARAARRASSSSTRSTPSAARAAASAPSPRTTSASRRSTSCSPRWTASIARAAMILMAATNRPEILDPALLRAGRFDRQVIVDRPDLRGREAILRVHARKAQARRRRSTSASIARRTPGHGGRRSGERGQRGGAGGGAAPRARASTTRDFEEAVDRIAARPRSDAAAS